jgi:hypothetical protein
VARDRIAQVHRHGSAIVFSTSDLGAAHRSIAGHDQAHIGADSLRFAHSPELALLQYTQQRPLRFQREFGHFIEKQGDSL